MLLARLRFYDSVLHSTFDAAPHGVLAARLLASATEELRLNDPDFSKIGEGAQQNDYWAIMMCSACEKGFLVVH